MASSAITRIPKKVQCGDLDLLGFTEGDKDFVVVTIGFRIFEAERVKTIEYLGLGKKNLTENNAMRVVRNILIYRLNLVDKNVKIHPLADQKVMVKNTGEYRSQKDKRWVYNYNITMRVTTKFLGELRDSISNKKLFGVTILPFQPFARQEATKLLSREMEFGGSPEDMDFQSIEIMNEILSGPPESTFVPIPDSGWTGDTFSEKVKSWADESEKSGDVETPDSPEVKMNDPTAEIIKKIRSLPAGNVNPDAKTLRRVRVLLMTSLDDENVNKLLLIKEILSMD